MKPRNEEAQAHIGLSSHRGKKKLLTLIFGRDFADKNAPHLLAMINAYLL
jgi:hypothetical protein